MILGDFRERLYPHARQSITIQNSLNWANTSGFDCSKTGYSFQEIALGPADIVALLAENANLKRQVEWFQR